MHYSSDRRGYRKKRKIRYTHDNSRSGRRNRISFAGFLERTISVLILILAILSVDIFGALFLICRGPSEKARDLFVSTVTQTSAAGFLAHIFLTDDEVTAILAKEESTGSMTGAISDTDMVTVNSTDSDGQDSDDGKSDSGSGDGKSDSGSGDGKSVSESGDDKGEDGIKVDDVSGPSFNGKMMIVSDPSRVHVYTLDSYSEERTGKQLIDMIDEEGAVAGVNAGGFYDPEGHGKGGLALGPVIRNGTLISDYESDYHTLIGFSADHKLMTGNIPASDAIAGGMNEGITFGPVLVSGGERVPFTDTAGGLNPRTAIGQTSDGSVLLLVINGRQPGSLGASFKDLVDVMLEYGAVNAANLDGGSSSLMYYKGEQLNSSASLVGLRPLPDAILVK
jgi:exopolysaccharide biosynthesis protein